MNPIFGNILKIGYVGLTILPLSEVCHLRQDNQIAKF